MQFQFQKESASDHVFQYWDRLGADRSEALRDRPNGRSIVLVMRFERRWLSCGGLDFEARPKSQVCRRSRGFQQTAYCGGTSKSRPPNSSQRRLDIQRSLGECMAQLYLRTRFIFILAAPSRGRVRTVIHRRKPIVLARFRSGSGG